MKKKTPSGTRRPALARTTTRKRKRGRPQAVHARVGKEALIASARKLVEELPPHEVTIALVARKAGVDPALVRYYFKNRENLLLAVVEDLLDDWALRPAAHASPAAQIDAHLSNLLAFSRSVRSMQRLMIEECAGAKSAAVRARVHELTAHVVGKLSGLIHVGGPASRSPDGLFLHVAMIGLCEFFAAAQPMILPLAPKGMSATELAARYDRFIRELVLDGVRKRLGPAGAH